MTITPEQITAFLDAIRPYCDIQDVGEGEYIIDGVINVGKALEAANARDDQRGAYAKITAASVDARL